jgi:signal transduction histidine kinase/CheY-like chemotaxis protein
LSGTIQQELAISLMRAGAHDFVSKDQPQRLDPVIRRELREAENRRARRHAEAEREAMLQQLQVANRAKDEFLAMLGHELRNPLAPIVTALQLIKLRGDGRPSREHEVIERQVKHLMRLVDDLLDVSKIAKGKVELKLRALDLGEVIAKGVEMASPLLEERLHHFKVDAPARGIIVVDGDEARLAQVVSNLLTNAARYTRPGGEVSLSARVEGQEAVIRVKDNGTGIDADMMPRIFELFVQGARPIDRSEGGLGIGLALVRNLVSLHGGTVSAHSDGRDRGSEFTVRLPLARPYVMRPPAPAAELSGRAPPPPHQIPLRVLLVDDNHDAVELLAEAVRLEGHEVAMAHDGPSALAKLDQFQANVVVLDIGLPVMDGYEVARQIRARPEHRATRLIALTGYGQAGDRQRAHDAGFDVHLVKPIDVQHLLVVMEELSRAAVA